MDRRKEELEKKRQKLQELRRAREERKNALTQPKEERKPSSGERKEEIDKLVQTLLEGGKERSHTPAEDSEDPDKGEKGSSTQQPPALPRPSAPSPIPSVPATPTSGHRYIPGFTRFDTVILDIAPKETVFYNKEVQTSTTSFAPPPPSRDEVYDEIMKELEEKRMFEEKMAEEERIKQENLKKQAEAFKELPDKDKENIMASADFAEFIDTTSKVVERVLSEDYDIMKDYRLLPEDDEGAEDTGNRVKPVCSFHDERWSQKRSVTDVSWSHKHPELSIASYNKNPIAVNDPDGIILVWNLHLEGRPEFVFHSQSDVLTTLFSPFYPNLVIGGTYSGQIALWDTRSKSLPVSKSPLSSVGHTHPVYSMQMVGTQNAHNLISASTDGLVCSWDLKMLAQQPETLELVHPTHSKTDEISVTSLGFPDNETTAFWVGTEEGNVYQANRFDRAGSKAGINQYDTYKGHWGPITGLQFHPLVGQVDFSDLFLTSSVDWTVKLWRSKSISKPSSQVQAISPLYSFEGADDYVYDAKWSPNHPALFASIDGTGKFALWNLNTDTEAPTVHTMVGNRALNKIQWDKEGKKVAIGSADGSVYIYDIGEMSHPRPDESTILQKTISGMSINAESYGGN